ncbi:MAG TPA: hypothetical protein VGR11_12650, partial [Solirubrobacteraceae bacterium]|nr:hypothetical protein [Solirubrobacteraceae bacterium]
AWLRATLGVLNRGAGGVAAWGLGSGAAVAGADCCDGAGAAAGAATLNEAGAKPPVAREAVMV